MTRRRRPLSEEDHALWDRVKRTVRPLPPHQSQREWLSDRGWIDDSDAIPDPKPAKPVKTAPSLAPPHAKPAQSAVAPFLPAYQAPGQAPAHGPLHPVDPATRRRIAKGRLPLEGRIDLHGMTQQQAHGVLRSFLAEARQRGLRTVIVITGKGSSPSSDGILRRMVPIWLTQPGFSDHVSGFSAAARGHGGDGAFYLRLKRQRSGSD